MPKLHSIMFGEGIMNDAVSILLFESLLSVNLNNLGAAEVFIFVGEFLLNCVGSIILGALFGLIASWLLKVSEALDEDPTHQTAVILYMAYISYLIATMLGISGVITMLVCSIVLGHYAWYNITAEAKHGSSIAVHFLGFASESLTFVYLGMSIVAYSTNNFSIYFLAAVTAIVLGSRAIAIFGMSYLVKLCSKQLIPLKWN